MAQLRSAGVGTESVSRAGGLRFACGVVLVGFASAAFAIAFRRALGVVFAGLGDASNVVDLMRGLPLWQRLLLPAAGGLAAGSFAWLVARSPQGNGVGDVMEAVVLGRVRLSLRVTLLKSLASFCAIASGGALGREGPLIQFGGACGKSIGDRLQLSLADTRRLIAAGTAAGFAAAYNTPFAAVLFVLEVVLGVVVLDTVVPVLIATVIAAECTRRIAGAGPIYGQRAFMLGSAWELLGFALLGALAALATHFFMRLLRAGEHTFKRIALPWRPALGGVLAGACVMVMPEVAGNGYEPLNEILDARFGLGFVADLLVLKCFATTASVTSGSPGGVFTPTLLVGGAIGSLFGTGISTLLGQGVGPVAGYALIGMASAIAASSHAPLTAAVLVFELSGDYGIVLPLAASTAIATAVGRALDKDSIYGAELRARGIGWALTIDGRTLDSANAGEASEQVRSRQEA